MGKKYDKPAIIGSTKVEPKGDSCQQGDEASSPSSPKEKDPEGDPARPKRQVPHIRIVPDRRSNGR